MLNLNEDTFYDLVEKEEKPVVIDFYGDWCPPCRVLAPKFVEWGETYKDKAVFAKANIDDVHNLAIEYRISAIPTIIAFKDGKEAKRWLGIPNEKDLAEFLEKE